MQAEVIISKRDSKNFKTKNPEDQEKYDSWKSSHDSLLRRQESWKEAGGGPHDNGYIRSPMQQLGLQRQLNNVLSIMAKFAKHKKTNIQKTGSQRGS